MSVRAGFCCGTEYLVALDLDGKIQEMWGIGTVENPAMPVRDRNNVAIIALRHTSIFLLVLVILVIYVNPRKSPNYQGTITEYLRTHTLRYPRVRRRSKPHQGPPLLSVEPRRYSDKPAQERYSSLSPRFFRLLLAS